MAWTAGTDATKESQCLGLNLSTVMENLGMDRWDKTGYYVLGFIKICIYLLFLNVIARCQSALLHLLPLHLSCLLTGFLRPWYVTNGHWPFWKSKLNFFEDALVVILQVHWLTQFSHKVRPGDAVLTTCHAKTGNPVPEVQVQSLLVRSSSHPIFRCFLKLGMISDHIRWRDLSLHELQELFVGHRSWGSSGAWGDEGYNL